VDDPTIVAAAILRDPPPRVLAARRTHPAQLAGRWELPGGKVEPGESDRAALRRECREELGIEVTLGNRLGPDLTVTVAGRPGTLRVWVARIVAGQPVPHDHDRLRWLTSATLNEVPWLPGDLPLVPLLRGLLTAEGDQGRS